jgi:hypothetical protein
MFAFSLSKSDIAVYIRGRFLSTSQIVTDSLDATCEDLTAKLCDKAFLAGVAVTFVGFDKEDRPYITTTVSKEPRDCTCSRNDV